MRVVGVELLREEEICDEKATVSKSSHEICKSICFRRLLNRLMKSVKDEVCEGLCFPRMLKRPNLEQDCNGLCFRR